MYKEGAAEKDETNCWWLKRKADGVYGFETDKNIPNMEERQEREGGVERKERNPKEDMFIISKAKSH